MQHLAELYLKRAQHVRHQGCDGQVCTVELLQYAWPALHWRGAVIGTCLTRVARTQWYSAQWFHWDSPSPLPCTRHFSPSVSATFLSPPLFQHLQLTTNNCLCSNPPPPNPSLIASASLPPACLPACTSWVAWSRKFKGCTD